MLIIENDFLKIELNKHGACLKSIFDKRKNKELLYQPDGRSWSGQDVVIFPVIAALKNHRYKVDGKSYSLKNHGLIRYNDVYLVNQTEEEITLGFDDNEETLILYPFKFHFEVTYKLENDKISIKYHVINKNDKTMYFSVGGHPALGVNLINGEFENVAIEVDGVFHKQYLLNEEGSQIVGERNINISGYKKLSKEERNLAYQEINTFERTLTDDGAVLIKLFLHISKKDQKKRFEKLLESKETAWRVSREDLERNKNYDGYKSILENMLEQTETEYAPWTIVEATDKKYATAKIYATVIHQLEEALKKRTVQKEEKQTEKQEKKQKLFEASVLSNADLSCSYTKEEYKERLQKLQKKIAVLHSELYRRRIPVVLGFEGWDAGGKGGAIKRLTEFMDPRGYVVNPTAAPTEVEKNHHYLWRFWQNMPKAGHIAIFDRTWYGRVMVERIEGFCTKEEWQRAYREINDMEAHLANSGAIVMKFWMQIDKDEQERRFKERMENPEKQWKITDEDWRNREKWEQYEEAVNEMIIKTSTSYAPWTIVEGNCKYYARIKVLETVVNEIEKRLKKTD